MMAKILTTPCLEKVTKLSSVISFINGLLNLKCLACSFNSLLKAKNHNTNTKHIK
ncbi:hypothetical protein D3C80_1716370 [compost metagenome]